MNQSPIYQTSVNQQLRVCKVVSLHKTDFLSKLFQINVGEKLSLIVDQKEFNYFSFLSIKIGNIE